MNQHCRKNAKEKVTFKSIYDCSIYDVKDVEQHDFF